MQTILTVNGGSSSLKCSLFTTVQEQLSLRYEFKLGNILNEPRIKIKNAQGESQPAPVMDFSDVPADQRHQAALKVVIQWLSDNAPELTLTAFGHRVVHGGEAFSQPVLIDPENLEALRAFIPLAPLHQPYNLLLIEACQALEPNLPQVACFDTMFHVGQPKVERYYALPRKLSDEGVHKYGFHGLSYEYIQKQLSSLSGDYGNHRTIICHLGAGASMCAVKNGQSVASTMGFTAVDGLPMGSRCGNIDPGVILYLQRHYDMSVDDVEKLIYKESGWLGVSGISSDMLTLQQSDQPEAKEAIEMFAYRVALEIGRLSAALSGLDQLVFTGGVGENDAQLREKILNRCEWLGISVNADANHSNESIISVERSSVVVRVVPTNEEAMIASHVLERV